MAQSYKLIKEVLDRSVSQDWDSAIDEWQIIGHDYVQSDGECACGKQHISELNYVRNRYTDSELIIGSECINKFFDINIKGIHPSIKRVNKDMSKSLHFPLVDSAFTNNIISPLEFKFYIDIHGKRTTSLSEKQKQWKQSINAKVLSSTNTINLKIN